MPKKSTQLKNINIQRELNALIYEAFQAGAGFSVDTIDKMNRITKLRCKVNLLEDEIESIVESLKKEFNLDDTLSPKKPTPPAT